MKTTGMPNYTQNKALVALTRAIGNIDDSDDDDFLLEESSCEKLKVVPQPNPDEEEKQYPTCKRLLNPSVAVSSALHLP